MKTIGLVFPDEASSEKEKGAEKKEPKPEKKKA